jgi:hypothetical protein
MRGEEQKRKPPAPPKKMFGKSCRPFDDGWPDYEETFIDVQA